MKRILAIIMMAIALLGAQAQTVHSLLFSNKEEIGRETDRTEELKNMSNFCTKIAEMLDYKHNMKKHSGSEFTSTQFLNDLDYMNVQEGDIVIFWYNGHGANWDDGDWPHMAFKDRQYSEQTAFDKLKAKCSNAKLILCFASCCNMDSQGRWNPGNAYYSGWSYKKVKELFTEFVGKKRIITSSSKRGQYSYSWTDGSKLGSIYGISFRDAMDVVLNSMSSMPVTWENVLETAKKKTMNYTSNHKEGSQVPQYKIEGGSINPIAKILYQRALLNEDVDGVPSLVVYVDFEVQNMGTKGCVVMPLYTREYDPSKSKYTYKNVADLNGRYNYDWFVWVDSNFTTTNRRQVFRNYKMTIPMSELHITDRSKEYYVRISIYDYETSKYIGNGENLKLDF